jgi:hypothetical protein
MKKQIFLMTLAVWLTLGLANLEAGVKHVHVRHAPPTKKVLVVKPAKPHAKVFWIDGRWHWNGKAYIWHEGFWEKPRTGFVWMAGQWKETPQGWFWIEGHWKKVK